MANDPTDTTKYPLGTNDLYVAARNASDFDKGLNAGNTTFVNRFGDTLPTFEKAISDAKANYGGLNNRGDWVTATNYAVNDLWQSTVDDTWYLVLTAYTSGVDEAADIASGNIEVFQGIARQDAVIKIASVFDVDAFARLEEGDAVELIGYHADTTVGGGSGVVKLARHNGGTAISLTRARPNDWTDQAQLTTWFEDGGSNELCWVRTEITGITSTFFGAFNDPENVVYPSQMQINKAYLVSQELHMPLEIVGDFYTNGQLTFSQRGGNYIIKALANIRANLDDAGLVDAMYVGDDSSHGIYPAKVLGKLRLNNVGTKRQTGKHGFHAQSAAYGYYNVTAWGFDIGTYLEGVIYATVDGVNDSNKQNNIDVVIETNQGVQGGLRTTNNLVTVKDLILGSSDKLKVWEGSDTINGLPASGGLIFFDNVLFEDNSNPETSTLEASISISRASEVNQVNLNKVKFHKCWFELFDKTKPLFKTTDSQIILDYCFLAHACNAGTSLFDLPSANASVLMRNTTGYFETISDPICNTYGSQATASRIILDNSELFGPSGTLPRIHDLIPADYVSDVRLYNSDGNTANVVYNLSKEYIGASNDYMQDGVLDLFEAVELFVGTGWNSFELTIYGSDGASSGVVVVRGVKGSLKTIIPIFVDGSVTLSGSTLTFPTSLDGKWFKPRVTITASISDYTYETS